MNFCTKALEFLSEFGQRAREARLLNDAARIQSLCEMITVSPKFLLPAGNRLSIKVTGHDFEFFRPPFPVTIFEYPIDTTAYTEDLRAKDGSIWDTEWSRKRLAIVIDFQDEKVRTAVHAATVSVPGKGIMVSTVYEIRSPKNGQLEWLPSTGAAFVPFDLTDEEKDLVTVNWNFKDSKFFVKLFYNLPDTANLMRKSEPFPGATIKSMETDLVEDVAIVLKALACLSAKNTKTIEVPAEAKLNKKRLKNGKPAMFDYKVLDIFVTPNSVRGGQVGPDLLRKHLDAWLSTSSNARLHTVRGHFKRRASGIFWWSNFVRGSKNLGEVKKDYSIGEKSRA